MDNLETIAALAALAQATRLDTFQLLVSREPDGVLRAEFIKYILSKVPKCSLAGPSRARTGSSPEADPLNTPSTGS